MNNYKEDFLNLIDDMFLNTDLKKSQVRNFVNKIIDESYNKIYKEIDESHFLLFQEVKSKYLGRGNSWIKISFNARNWNIIESTLNNSDHPNSQEYLDYFKELGFAWCRHYKTNDKESLFEIRLNGPLSASKVKFSLSLKESLKLELLGGTPISSQIENSEGFGKVVEINRKVEGDMFVNNIFALKEKDNQNEIV
jgi:hypothetical protein